MHVHVTNKKGLVIIVPNNKNADSAVLLAVCFGHKLRAANRMKWARLFYVSQLISERLPISIVIPICLDITLHWLITPTTQHS